jgi:two-component system LytT family response regulator
MLKVIIADEAQIRINSVTEKLTHFFPGLDIIAVATTSHHLQQLLTEPAAATDLLFVSTGLFRLSRLHTSATLRARVAEIILLDADLNGDRMSVAGVEGLGYLGWPLQDACMVRTVQEAILRKYATKAPAAAVLPQLCKQHAADTIMLHSAREVHFIPVSQIVRVMGDNNYSIFTLMNSSKITVARTLREYESVLEPHHFYRIHKSHIINLNYLVKVNKGDEFSVLMSDGAALEIASRRRTDFLRLMQEWCV